MANWKNYEELKPSELEKEIRNNPIAYWPLGLIEHHGWHLPIGFDGIKAYQFCRKLAEKNGGLILPTMWWGGGGGHDVFKWTHYQDLSAAQNILETTARQMLDYGIKILILFAGHYPWQKLLDNVVESLRETYPDTLILAGTEMSICEEDSNILGDHAAKEETSWGLSLFPEHIDINLLHGKIDVEVWPPQGPPAKQDEHPKVNYDPKSPLFAQMGEDAREATAEHGNEVIKLVIEKITNRIQLFSQKDTDKINNKTY